MKQSVKNPLALTALILVFVALMLPVTAYLGYRRNLGNIEQMLYSKGSALLVAVLHEAENALIADREILDALGARLADNCRFSLLLHSRGALDQARLSEIARQAGLARLDLYSGSGKLTLSSDPPHAPAQMPGVFSQIEEEEGYLAAFLAEPGDDEQESYTREYFAVLVFSPDSAAGVAYLDTERLAEVRRRFGIGLILEDIAAIPGVGYAVLQDTLGIIAASHQVAALGSIQGDPFFPIPSGETKGRYTDFNGEEVYELASTFQLGGENYGYLRVGLTTEEIRSIAARDRRRFIQGILVLAVLLIVVGALYLAGRRQLRLEQEHSRIKGFSQSVLEGMAEAVIVVDQEKRIVLINRTCENLCGCPPGLSDKESLQSLSSELAQAVSRLEQESLSALEIEFQQPDGTLLPVMISTSAITVAGKSFTTIILSDLTDRKQAEQLALHTQRYKTMAEVSAGMAHEIRNPLNAIGMNVQRLKLEFSPEAESRSQYEDFIDTIRSEVARLNGIVEQFLKLARFPEPKMEPLRIDRLIQETLDFIRPELTGRGIKLVANLTEAPEFLFDPGQIKQVVTNLATNAAEAMGDSGTLTIEGTLDSGNYRIAFHDTGPGIPEQEQERIFEPFFSTKRGGMGLGLAIVERIVSEHGGTVRLESEQGRGAAFIVSLPVKTE
jgi:two-component system sensor histidine kinase HydH